MAANRQIVAMGGGGFSMEQSPALDDYVLSLCDKPKPRVCFLPTAAGDADAYIVRFYRAFHPGRAVASHLELFSRDGRDLRELLLDQDVIYVGGGNTANMIAVWMLHGVDAVMREAWDRGIVLCGISAGAICWFENGVSDSFGPDLCALDCLGLVDGSFCPHYDGDANRRPAYHTLVGADAICDGYAADDGAAAHFIGNDLHRAIRSRDGAKLYRVRRDGENVVEQAIETTAV